MPIDMNTHSSGFSICLDEDEMSRIENKAFRLVECGEILNVGDKFTKMHSSGSAGLPDISLNEGWYQEFKGLITITHNDESVRIALFDAYHIATGESALKDMRARTGNQNWFMGYIALEEYGHLTFMTHILSIRAVTCNGITRYQRNERAH